MRRTVIAGLVFALAALGGRVSATFDVFLPPAGTDDFPASRAIIEVQPLFGGPLQHYECSGPTMINRGDPDPLTGMIQTEMLSLSLQCTGGVRIMLNPTRPTMGQVSRTGDSFFDVFFEVEGLPGIQMAINQEPARMQATIAHIAPYGAVYAGVRAVTLVDAATGQPFAQVTDLQHFVNGQTKPETIGEVSPVFSCFYECKPNLFTLNVWREVTTLMLVNQTPKTPILADLLIFNGNERAIAHTQTLLSPQDLDEINICETLNSPIVPGGIPQAGLIEVVLTSALPGQVGIPVGGAYGWMKNVVGGFVRGNPEPFRGFVNAVAKVECRLVGPNVVRPEELLAQLPIVPFTPPRLIEGTADQPANCQPSGQPCIPTLPCCSGICNAAGVCQ